MSFTHYGLLLYLILMIVRPHEYLEALQDLGLHRYILIVTFLMWLFKSSKSWGAPQQVLVPLLFVMMLVSLLVRGWFGGVLAVFEEMAPLLMLFLVTATLAESPRHLLAILRAVCLCTLVLVAHGLDQVLTNGVGWTGQPMETLSGPPRIQYIGVFADPNDLAMLFVFSFPLACYLASQAGKLLRLFWAAAAALMAVGVYLTNSRGGLLALLAVIGLWCIRKFGRIATVVIAVLTIPTLIAATRLSEVDVDEESAAGRVDAWYTALQLFQEHPLTGVGYGLFTEYNDLTAHNSWLLVLSELGIVGYVCWLAAAGFSMQQLWTLGKAEEANEARSLARTLFYSGVGLLSCAFFLSRSYSMLFFLFWGCTAGLYNAAAGRDPAVRRIALPELGGKWAGIAVATVPAYYLLVRVLLIMQ